jgi:hypothetical protein
MSINPQRKRLSVATWLLHGVCHVGIYLQNQQKTAGIGAVANQSAPSWTASTTARHFFGA